MSLEKLKEQGVAMPPIQEATERQVYLLKHCLGCRDAVDRSNWGYRNGVCVSVDSEMEGEWISLVYAGLAVAGGSWPLSHSRYYHATRDGALAAGISPTRVDVLFPVAVPEEEMDCRNIPQ